MTHLEANYDNFTDVAYPSFSGTSLIIQVLWKEEGRTVAQMVEALC